MEIEEAIRKCKSLNALLKKSAEIFHRDTFTALDVLIEHAQKSCSEPNIPPKKPTSVDLKYNCTLAKFAEQIGIKLWQAMCMMKYAEKKGSEPKAFIKEHYDEFLGYYYNSPCSGCKDGHASFWKTITESPEWKAWKDKNPMAYDFAECEELGILGKKHFDDFIAFVRTIPMAGLRTPDTIPPVEHDDYRCKCGQTWDSHDPEKCNAKYNGAIVGKISHAAPPTEQPKSEPVEQSLEDVLCMEHHRYCSTKEAGILASAIRKWVERRLPKEKLMTTGLGCSDEVDIYRKG